MGIELVEGGDLIANDGYIEMRTTKGPRRVDVIYRRINDDFLDPLLFRLDSLIGVPGIFEAYKKGRLSLVNAPGTGGCRRQGHLCLCPCNYQILSE